jgi:hypothetical protein
MLRGELHHEIVDRRLVCLHARRALLWRSAAARAARDSSAAQAEQWLDSWFDPAAQERLRAAVARLRT